jgi:hypothetical protein
MKHEWRQILRNFYRDSRLQAVDKCTFPTLLAKLWSKINVSVIISGFLGAGLFPLDRSKPSKKLLLSQIAEKDTENGTSSPFKLLRQSILKVLSPEEPFQKMKVTRKRRLPNTHGRILSDDAALIQLAPQHEDNIHKIKKTNLVKKITFRLTILYSVQRRLKSVVKRGVTLMFRSLRGNGLLKLLNTTFRGIFHLGVFLSIQFPVDSIELKEMETVFFER